MENSKVNNNERETKIESEEVRLSQKKDLSFYVFISKVVLKKFGKLTLSSLGSVCDNAVKVADKLERGGYATIEKIASDTVELEQRNNKEHKRNVTRFTIEMKKTSKFDELVKDKIK